ncbi:hypothetical protein GIB67_002636 [Kingdonia uniflora]|uniref:Uncharacterized protein n=1 Tax=Kingdonia uniflora TaxID=39325 RepID=A0A7J7N4J6_9MAGN|nr:hypothetical protein GIB67_002636 [Kingdonia uniflora]
MHTCLKIMAPLVDVIRVVDTEEKPSMAYIYSAIEDCKLRVRTNLGDQNEDDRELWKKMEIILDRKWSSMLQKLLHAAAHYLNPQYYYATLTSSDEMESNTKLKEGLLDCTSKLALDEEDESQILQDLIVYRTKAGRLGKRGAQACVKTIAPGTDMTYGVLVDAKNGFDDPPLTRTSRTNTASHCSQRGASSSRSTTRHLQDSSDNDDYDVDVNYDVGDGDDDGIDSGSDEDI